MTPPSDQSSNQPPDQPSDQPPDQSSDQLSDQPSDQSLVSRTLNGDRGAFDRLVERHFGMVYAAALARLDDPEAAEDLSQEVFLRGFLHLRDLRDPRYFGTWMGRAARNLAMDWVRRRQTRSRLIPLVTNDPQRAVEALPDPRKGVRERMDEQTEHAALHHALSQLDVQQREILLLHYMEGMPKNVIAARLGVHPATVGRHIDQALGQLHGILEPMLRRGFDPLRPTPKAVAGTLSTVALVSALSVSARSELLTAVAWQQGAASIAAASSSLAATGLSAKLSAILAVGGITSMGIVKTAGIAAAVVVVIGGAFYVARPSHSSSRPTGAPTSSSSPVDSSINNNSSSPSAWTPLPPIPPGYTVNISDHESMMMSINNNNREFIGKSVDIESAAGTLWGVPVVRIIKSGNVPSNKKDILIKAPSRSTPQKEFDEVARVIIQRTWGVRVHVEKQLVDVIVITAPNGVPAVLHPSSDPNASWTSQWKNNKIKGQALYPMKESLQSEEKKTVIDETGINGKFDYEYQSGKTRYTLEKVMGCVLKEEKREMDVLFIEPDPGTQNQGKKP